MYHVVIAVDEDTARAQRQARTVGTSRVRSTTSGRPCSTSSPRTSVVRRRRRSARCVGPRNYWSVEVAVTERSGDPASTVLDFAQAEDGDCICVGGRQRSPAGKAIFGSVAQSLILQADRPVLVTGSVGGAA